MHPSDLWTQCCSLYTQGQNPVSAARAPGTDCCHRSTSPSPCAAAATQAQIVCSGCRTLLLYPSGAANVRCARCQTITSAVVPQPQPQQQGDFAQLCCSNAQCRVVLMYPRGAGQVGALLACKPPGMAVVRAMVVRPACGSCAGSAARDAVVAVGPTASASVPHLSASAATALRTDCCRRPCPARPPACLPGAMLGVRQPERCQPSKPAGPRCVRRLPGHAGLRIRSAGEGGLISVRAACLEYSCAPETRRTVSSQSLHACPLSGRQPVPHACSAARSRHCYLPAALSCLPPTLTAPLHAWPIFCSRLSVQSAHT